MDRLEDRGVSRRIPMRIRGAFHEPPDGRDGSGVYGRTAALAFESDGITCPHTETAKWPSGIPVERETFGLFQSKQRNKLIAAHGRAKK